IEESQTDVRPVSAKAPQLDDVGYSEAELTFLTDDWETRIIYDDIKEEQSSLEQLLPYTNDELLDGEWIYSIDALADIDSTSRETPSFMRAKVLLNLNDRNILLEPVSEKKPSDARRRGRML